LKNFGNVLTDSTFWDILWRTVTFTAVNVVLSLLIGLGIALLLNRVSRWARIILVMVLLFAWAIPTTVSTQVFYWLFSNPLRASSTTCWTRSPASTCAATTGSPTRIRAWPW